MAMCNMDLTLDPDNLLKGLNNDLFQRSDLHTAFGDRKLVLFLEPKDGLVVHMLEPTSDIGQLYHNTRLHALSQCSLQLYIASKPP